MLPRFIIGIISQYTQISNDYDVCLKLIYRYILIIPQLKKIILTNGFPETLDHGKQLIVHCTFSQIS